MDQALEDQARYYELNLADCRRRPGIHRAQVAAYERHRQLARAADTVEQYMASTGQFDIAHAESLDRHRTEVAVHTALGNERKLVAAQIMLEAVEDARSVAAMWTRVAAASPSVHSRRVRETVCAHEVARVVIALFEWAPVAYPLLAKLRLQELLNRWATLRRHDPDCDWQKLCEYPPYRHRLPFDDAGMRSLGALLTAALSAADKLGLTQAPGVLVPPDPPPPEQMVVPEPPPRPPLTDYDPRTNPSVAEIVAGYHQHYELLDPGDPGAAAVRAVYDRMFEIEGAADTVPGFYRALAEERLLCKLAAAEHVARARDSLDRCLPRAHPYLEHHHSLLATGLVACRTRTEVEYELLVAEECLDVEADWNEALMACATRPLRAALRFGTHPDPQSAKCVVDSLRLTCHLLGTDWSGLMSAPRLDTFMRSELFELGQAGVGAGAADYVAPDQGARRGHAGMHIVAELRSAIGEDLVKEGASPTDDTARRFPTADALVAHLRQLVEGAHDGGVVASAKRDALVLWDQPLSFAQSLDAALAPPRPTIDIDGD